MRVYEYARKNGLSSKEMIRILDEECGFYNITAQSNITEDMINEAQKKLMDSPFEIEDCEINSKDFYDVKSELIDQFPEANYYIAVSPRGVGKTTNAALCAIKEYLETGNPSVLLRRREVDLSQGVLRQMFGEICSLNYIKNWSKKRWNSIYTVGMRSYLCNRDEDGKITDRDKNWFMYAIPLSQSGNIKGVQLNRPGDQSFVRYIIFDEIIPVSNALGNGYLPDEANIFFNTLSTIIRIYDKAKIILLGNTIVNGMNPILSFMNIDLLELALGEKRLYKFDSEDEKKINYVCCHLIDKKQYKGVSDVGNEKYYNFNNKKLNQITGENSDEYSVWELSKDFNGKPMDYKKSDIIFKFYWIYCNDVYVGNVVQTEECLFIFNHKTGHKYSDGWLNEQEELIFSNEIIDPRPNWINSLSGCKLKMVNKIVEIMASGKVYYQNAWISNYAKALFNNM